MAEKALKGRYHHLAEIGRGERTTSYKAEDTLLDRIVVVKVLREQYAVEEDSVDRFHNAARAMAGLSHPNIVAIHDIGSDRDLHYVVTEHIDGQNLESLLESQAPLSPEQTLDIAIPVCAALGAAHRKGYVHGQLTPRDILLTRDQQVKVSNFGVVGLPHPMRQPQEPASRYSALYVSREQAMGRRASPASDVYSLGVILYEALSGRPPFDGETFSEIADKHIREEAEPLSSVNPQVPGPLSELVHGALAKTSTDRYRTASELEETLSEYRRQSGQLELLERVEGEQRALEEERVGIEIRAYPLGAAEDTYPPPLAGTRPGPDWVGCLVGILAFVAVLGLIPLWVTVFLRYFV